MIKDSDQTPNEYLDAYAATLGIILPHSFDTLDPDAAHRFLSAIVAFYKRKGCLPSLEWIATEYLGIPITIFQESRVGHYFGVTYNDTIIPTASKPVVFAELTNILNLYSPAGLMPLLFPQSQGFPLGEVAGGDNSHASPYSVGKGDVNGGSGDGDLGSDSFELNVIISG